MGNSIISTDCLFSNLSQVLFLPPIVLSTLWTNANGFIVHLSVVCRCCFVFFKPSSDAFYPLVFQIEMHSRISSRRRICKYCFRAAGNHWIVRWTDWRFVFHSNEAFWDIRRKTINKYFIETLTCLIVFCLISVRPFVCFDVQTLIGLVSHWVQIKMWSLLQ